MHEKYKSATRIGKTFFWLSVILVAALVIAYVMNVVQALNMKPDSFNCLHDSMMKQICADPWGSSITWSFIQVFIMGSPLLFAWLGVGIVVLAQRNARKTHARERASKDSKDT